MERGAGWRGIEWRRGQTANTLRGVNGLNLLTEGRGWGEERPPEPYLEGEDSREKEGVG